MRESLSERLLSWYDANRRQLPWREKPSLYRTIVSEFMLQQTQVKTMLPYFDRWMAVFPDFETLAASSEPAAVKMWEGLGYYRRARFLRQLAQRWVEAVVKPRTYAEWLEYPGVGPYMAAAIASIDFNEPVVVVDGNVVRVIARLRKFETRFSNASAAVSSIRPFASEIISESRPGDFNQALMELGATVCRPQAPQCLLCPWFDDCEARKAGCVESIPNIRKAKTERIIIPRMLVLDEKAERMLLQEGGLEGRLDGIYELPPVVGEVPEQWKPIATIKRGISNQMITEPIYQLDEGNYRKWVHKKTEPEWIPLKNIEMVSLSGPHRKWISGFLASGEGSC